MCEELKMNINNSVLDKNNEKVQEKLDIVARAGGSY